VDEITRLIVEKLLLTPTEQLKAVSDEATAVSYADALNKLFRLASRDSGLGTPDRDSGLGTPDRDSGLGTRDSPDREDPELGTRDSQDELNSRITK
jgi:hypothetical protein